MRRAIAAGDAEALGRAADALKGSDAVRAAPPLARRCDALSRTTRIGRVTDNTRRHFDAVCAELTETRAAMEQAARLP